MGKIEFPRFIIGAMRLGAWGANMSPNELEVFVNGCIELGFNTFDHADIYGDYTTEYDFGKVLKSNTSLRSNIKLITKCGIRKMCVNRPEFSLNSYDSRGTHIIESVENSLLNFNTDYIDTLLIHRPDYLMEADELAASFQKLKESGKVLHFGVSNFSASQYDLLNKAYPLVTNQIQFSLLNNAPLDNGLLDHGSYNNISIMAWSPLGGETFSTRDQPLLIGYDK